MGPAIKFWLAIILFPLCAFAQIGVDAPILYQQPVASGGGGNNLTIVQSASTNGPQTTTPVTVTFSSVTSGNMLEIQAVIYDGSVHTIATGDISKTGTSTTGTLVMDIATNEVSGSVGLGLFHLPITGNGNVTIALTKTGAQYLDLMVTEVHNYNTSTPVDVSGKNTTATLKTASSGSLASVTTAGAVFYLAEVEAAGNWYSVWSDTQTGVDTNASTVTYMGQYKLQSSSPSAITNSTDATSTLSKIIWSHVQSN